MSGVLRFSAGAFAIPFIFLIPVQTLSQSELPWLANIDPAGKRSAITSIRTRANVTVSDGKKYVAETFYVDPQRAVFRTVYPDRTLTQAIEGKYFWTSDGKKEQEAPPQAENIVLGHQVHAQILFFDSIHRGSIEVGESKLLSSVTAEDRSAKWTVLHDSGAILFFWIAVENRPRITVRLWDWREVKGILLPHAVAFMDGERVFSYEYTSIELNSGDLADYRAPESVLTDEQRLLRNHRIVMDDHFFENAEGMKSINSDMTVVSRGEVIRMSGADADAGFDRLMQGKDHFIYDDLIRPEVKISRDGTLGWVIVRVYAKGTYLDEEGNSSRPLEFTSAWIEMYEKIDGRWLMTGNVSNFVPEDN